MKYSITSIFPDPLALDLFKFFDSISLTLSLRISKSTYK